MSREGHRSGSGRDRGRRHASAISGLAARLLRVRSIARAPVWLYRARLGFVFGSRLLMLEHTGRTTGARRPAAATARPLTRQEAAAVLAVYAARHPRAWVMLRALFEQTLGARIDSQATTLPLIALELAGSIRESAQVVARGLEHARPHELPAQTAALLEEAARRGSAGQGRRAACPG